MSDNVIAQGLRSVAIGHDVINSIIVTGDHNRFFIGDYVRLKDAYIAPWPVFERVNLRRFTGREWLLAEVDAFLSRQDRGYFVLEAEAGLGKTTFLAWLVQQRGYIHHFVELAPGQEGIDAGLKNLGAQLVLNYHLEAWAAEGVLPGYAGRSQYLTKLLGLAAETRQEGEKIVLVVDALDEADTPPGGNVLGLPQVLPEGVYVIASQRPVAVTLQVDSASTPRRVLPLVAGSAENQADMRRYLEGAATWSGITEVLNESGYSAEQFVATLLNKCQGLWIYLHYVAHEIENGDRTPLELDKLPEGMTQYYAGYWRQWRDRDEMAWYGAYLPLLATLAAAQEAVSAERLLAWTGTSLEPPRLERLLNERWRPFMAFSETGEVRRYRFYHATLAEFFAGQIDRTKLNAAELAMVEELAKRTREAHSRLADRYLVAWGGLPADLPGLREGGKRDLDDGYGLRHLARHLASAQRWDELHVLVAEGNGDRQPWAEARQRLDVSQSGYLADLALAWDGAYRMVQTQEDPPESSRALARCLQYALIASSINSLTNNYDPALVGRAVELRYWPTDQALAAAERVQEMRRRSQIYSYILRIGNLTSAERRQALQAALTIPPDQYDEDTLTALATQLAAEFPDRELPAVLAAPRAIKDNQDRGETTTEVPPKLTTEVHKQTPQAAPPPAQSLESEAAHIEAVQGIKSSRRLREVLTEVVPKLNGETKERTLNAVFKAALAIRGKADQAAILLDLTSELTGEMQEQALKAALIAAGGVEGAEKRIGILMELLPRLTGEMRKQALEAVWKTTQNMDEEHRVKAYRNLLTRSASNLEEETLRKVLAVAQAVKTPEYRIELLATLTPLLTGEAQQEVLKARLAAIQAIPASVGFSDLDFRARTLRGLVSDWSGDGIEQVLTAALEAARCLPVSDPEPSLKFLGREVRAQALAQLACQLTGDLLPQALAIVRTIEDEEQLASALAKLAPRLTGDLLPQALIIVRIIKNEEQRARALASLAPRLSGDLFTEGMADAQAIQDKGARDRALAAFAAQLRGELLEHGLEVIRTIEDDGYRVQVLQAWAPDLPSDQLERVIAVVRTMQNGLARFKAVKTLAQRLEAGQMASELVAALVMVIRQGEGCDLEKEIKDLVQLITSLPPQLRDQVVAQALVWVLDFRYSWMIGSAMEALLPYLTEDSLVQAIPSAEAIEDPSSRAGALRFLADKLDGQVRERVQFASRAAAIVAEFREVQSEPDSKERTAKLAKWAPQWPIDLVRDGLAWCQAIHDEAERAQAMVLLAPRLTGEARERILTAALAAVRSVKADDKRAAILEKLAPHLADNLLAEALAAAKDIRRPESRVPVLAALTPKLTGEARNEAQKAWFEAAEAIHFPTERARAWIKLAEQWEGDGKDQALAVALEAARNARDEYGYGFDQKPAYKALADLGPLLTTTVLEEALATLETRSFSGPQEEAGARVIFRLAPWFTRNMAAQALESKRYRHDALVALAPYLTGDLAARGLAAVAEAFLIGDERCRVLVALAPQLTGDLAAQALAAAQTLESEEHRRDVLVALAPQLTGDLAAPGLAAAQALPDPKVRVAAVTALLPQLTAASLDAAVSMALSAIQAVMDADYRAEALTALAPRLPEDAREQVRQSALLAAQAIETDYSRARALTALAPQLTGNAREQALELAFLAEASALAARLSCARGIEDPAGRARALIALAPKLTGVTQEQAMNEGLMAAMAVEWPSNRARILTELAPSLTGKARERALKAALTSAEAIEETKERANALVSLAPLLTDVVRQQALASVLAKAHSDDSPFDRIQVLETLAPLMTGELLAAGVNLAKDFEDRRDRATALAILAQHAQGNGEANREIRKTLASGLYEMLAAGVRSEVLSFCFDRPLFAPPVLAEETMPDVARAVINTGRWWP